MANSLRNLESVVRLKVGRDKIWQNLTVLLFTVRAVAAVALVVPCLLAPSVTSLAVACAAALLIAGSFVRWILLLLIAEPDYIPPASGLRVAIVTSFVPSAESLPMLERTLAAMTRVAYAHDTWLLDEGDDEAAIELCQRLGVKHFSRKCKPEYQTGQGRLQRGTKHGNYNAWLTERGFADYDVLAAIDPDHVPDTSFLMETLGQLSDPSIAYVQSPQEYYNLPASVIARGCSEESRDYYWITQRAYQRFRSPSVIGCHGVHRMQVLKTLGGLAAHIADDLLLTLQYQMSGWKGAYVPKVLAKGLAPVDWPTYLKQQRRWASSLFDVKFRLYPRMTRAMPLSTRVVGFLQGLTYFQDAAAAMCCAIALCAVLMTGLPTSFASTATTPAFLISAGVLLITGVYPHLYHGSHRNLAFYWRAAWLRMVKWPYTLLALSSLIRRRDRGYELTTKGNQPSAIDWALYWPHLLICAIVFAAWAFGVSRGSTSGLLPHLLAALAVLPSLTLIASSLREAPAAFDPMLADRHIDEVRS